MNKKTGKTKIWAHRGASAYAPENTMEAFEKAIELKADGIELDVQLSKDGRLVVIHDERIDRTSDGKGWVKDYNFEDLSMFNYNNHQPDYKKCSIPRLEQVLERLEKEDLSLNIELKTSLIGYKGIEEKVLESIAHYGMEDRVIVSSFNHYSLIKSKKIRPDIKVGILTSDVLIEPEKYMETYHIDAFHPMSLGLRNQLEEEPDLLDRLKEVNVWGLLSQDREWLYDLGLHSLIVDAPDDF